MTRAGTALAGLLLAAAWCLGVVPTAWAAPPAGPLPPPPADEVLGRMLEAQQGLRDFTADVTLSVKVGIVPLVPLHGRLSATRPSQVKVRWSGAVFHPRHPFLFPDPEEFTSGRYALSVAGWEEVDGQGTWAVDVTPLDPAEKLRMRFWIAAESWLIVQSDLSLPGAGRTMMKARYVRGGDHAWVPAELSGRGGLLILDLLPAAALGRFLSGLGLTEKMTFRATLTNHQVNTGAGD